MTDLTKNWETLKEPEKHYVQVLPCNDLKEHLHSPACKCVPRVERIDFYLLIVHNAYDGREFAEEDGYCQ